MLQTGWQIIQEGYEKYEVAGGTQLLLIISIIAMLIKEKKYENRHFAYYIITLLIIIFSPPIAVIFSNHFIGSDVYWRVFWLVPTVIVIAFVATKLIEKIGKKSKQRLSIFTIIILIMVGGTCVYHSGNFTKSTNSYKIPQEAVDICKMVEQEGTIKIVVPETIVSYIRQYNPNIRLMYGRNMGKDVTKGDRYEFLMQLNSTDPDIEFIAEFARDKKCDYVVFENISNGIEGMENYGYELFGNTEHYTIFKNVDE
ncbi:MAG: DUF6056 family protein [Lachnotalea sp.]